MKVLTADQALANAVARHSLVEQRHSIEDVARQLVGLHNTSPVSPYLSLLARVPGFVRNDLDVQMWQSWRLVRMRAMRRTLFVFPLDLLEIAVAATRQIGEGLAARWLRDSGLTQTDFDRLADQIEEALADGPLTVRSLREVLGTLREVNLSGVVGRMCDAGRLVGGAPPRSWRSSVREYHRWSDVLPGVDLDRWEQDEAIRALLERYLRSYGPVTVDDMSWWTGLTKERCRAALEQIDIEEAVVDGWPGPLFRIRDDAGPVVVDSEVRALPLLDPYVQGYRNRERFLEPDRHAFVYDWGGNATATLVRGGRIIGVWQFMEQPDDSVRYHLFESDAASIRSGAEEALAAAGLLYFARPVDVVEVRTMKPLGPEHRRSAAHPLDHRLHRAGRRRTS
jgi:hypothetical protein